MSEPSDYLALAYLQSLEEALANARYIPDSYVDVHEKLTGFCGREFSESYTRAAVSKLENWGLLRIISDQYAGDLIVSDRENMQSPYSALQRAGISGLYAAGRNGGNEWFSRVFSNENFWRNFEAESDGSGEGAFDELEVKGEVPASDRFVTLTHNQIESISTPLNDLIAEVEPLNSVGDEGGLRELILGKLRAGRELIKAGIFSLQSLQLTLIAGLRMLVEKHKDTAIAITATKLLDLLLKECGIG